MEWLLRRYVDRIGWILVLLAVMGALFY